jgi:predicted oxidoreductase
MYFAGELEQTKCDISSKASKIASLEVELKMSDDHMTNMVENALTDLRCMFFFTQAVFISEL